MKTQIHTTLLQRLEASEAGPGSIYKHGEDITYDTKGKDVIMLSDLHIGAGVTADGRYDCTENFFADDSFRRFLTYTREKRPDRKSTLIINGDFVDFIRITNYPEEDKEFGFWKNELEKVGIRKPLTALKESIGKKEVKFGLKTNDYKSIYKLACCMEGHKEFFRGLAEWVTEGNMLIIGRGNHDLEWYFPKLRSYFCLRLAELIAADQKISVEKSLQEIVIPHLLFFEDHIIIDKTVYVEHGHRFDKYSYVIGDPVLKGTEELNLPYGLFFNRYLINRIELAYPYFDNVRPHENLFPMLVRENFPMALKLLFVEFPSMMAIIPRRYFTYMYKSVLQLIVPIVLPVLLCLFLVMNDLRDTDLFNHFSNIPRFLVDIVKYLATLLLSYFLAKMVAFFQLTEPSSLYDFSEEIFRTHPEIQIACLGHTHNPEQVHKDGKWFFNTGTWIPVVEASNSNLRFDKTFTYLSLRHNEQGKIEPGFLQRWSDEAGREEGLIVLNRKC